MAQQAGFDFGRPHHAGTDDQPQGRDVPAARVCVEGGQDGLGEGIADDRQFRDPLGGNGVKQGFWVEVPRIRA